MIRYGHRVGRHGYVSGGPIFMFFVLMSILFFVSAFWPIIVGLVALAVLFGAIQGYRKATHEYHRS